LAQYDFCPFDYLKMDGECVSQNLWSDNSIKGFFLVFFRFISMMSTRLAKFFLSDEIFNFFLLPGLSSWTPDYKTWDSSRFYKGLSSD
jgi:hypothetical protein